jgi:hypothetical protein
MLKSAFHVDLARGRPMSRTKLFLMWAAFACYATAAVYVYTLLP